ncbi:MAG: hypothetical protein RR357_05030 [Clostridia bacterium]
MNKKLLLVLVCVLVLAFALTACNKGFKQDAVGGAELSKPVENNGGLVVKQGKHIYFINGYLGIDADNTFGTPYKTALMRAELDVDGKIVENSQVVIVPKNIYSASTTSGIYIYDGWIYYATPNTELDKKGEVNTKYLDFMRTKIDATQTQLLFTIDNRSVNFKFCNGFISLFNGGDLYKIDLSAKKVNNEKNYVSVMNRISGVKMICSDTNFGNFNLAVRNLPDEEAYKTYNELWAVSADGSIQTKLIGGATYDKSATPNTNNLFKIGLLNYVVESDGLTIYYTKTKTIGGTAQVVGLYSYKFTTLAELDPLKEKQLTYNTATTVTPISSEGGVLISESARVILAKADATGKPAELSNEQKVVIDEAATVKFISNGFVYYTATSAPKAIYRIKLDGTGVEEKVFDVNPLTTWIDMELVGNYLYYIDSVTNYTHRYNIAGELGKKPELVGKMTAEDAKKFAEADKKE